MSLSVNAAGLASSSQSESTLHAKQTQEIIKDLLATYQFLDLGTTAKSHISKIMKDLDSLAQSSEQNPNIALNLLKEFRELANYLEATDPELLEAAFEGLGKPKKVKKGSLEYAIEHGFLAATQKMETKIPNNLLWLKAH